ncbi:MAG TPA: hypothetical protein VLL51_03000 [Gemmatimonadales bacterium]|nr:hypothetical protein [Gemmatimonadales bacterium]
MLRRLGLYSLLAFVAWTGVYVFVYLWRAFQVDGPTHEVVRLWHGDNFARSLLVAVFFLVGLTVLGFVWVARSIRGREGTLPIRRDLLDWLEEEAEATRETPSVLAERAIADYRTRLEGPGAPRSPR